jgi:hypothetical protein
MGAIYHWAGLALAFLFIGWAFVGFWRGLSLRPTKPETRPKGWDTLWWNRYSAAEVPQLAAFFTMCDGGC